MQPTYLGTPRRLAWWGTIPVQWVTAFGGPPSPGGLRRALLDCVQWPRWSLEAHPTAAAGKSSPAFPPGAGVLQVMSAPPAGHLTSAELPRPLELEGPGLPRFQLLGPGPASASTGSRWLTQQAHLPSSTSTFPSRHPCQTTAAISPASHLCNADSQSSQMTDRVVPTVAMDSVPISGLEELQAHLQQLVDDPAVPFNLKAMDDVEFQLTGRPRSLKMQSSRGRS